jgi:hypothetical protein
LLKNGLSGQQTGTLPLSLVNCSRRRGLLSLVIRDRFCGSGFRHIYARVVAERQGKITKRLNGGESLLSLRR